MTPPVPPQRGPLADGSAVFSADTAMRVAAATRYVEKMYRNPKPEKGDSRGPGTNGQYGYIAPGATVTGISGATLGSGTVNLCLRSGAALTQRSPAVNVPIYNAGGGVTGAASTGTFVKLGWANGAWSLDVVLCS